MIPAVAFGWPLFDGPARGPGGGRRGRWLRRVALALILPVTVVGCSATRSDPMAGRMGGGSASIQLRVTNLGFNDATLTAISTGARVRLGVVPGKANQNFTIPWEALQELRVQISVLAGGNYTTPTVTVNPGERVELLIQENLRSSQLRR